MAVRTAEAANLVRGMISEIDRDENHGVRILSDMLPEISWVSEKVVKQTSHTFRLNWTKLGNGPRIQVLLKESTMAPPFVPVRHESSGTNSHPEKAPN